MKSAKTIRSSDKGFCIVETYHYRWDNNHKAVPMVVQHMGGDSYQAYPEYAEINEGGLSGRMDEVTIFSNEDFANRICAILNERKYGYYDEKFEVRPCRRTLTIG